MPDWISDNPLLVAGITVASVLLFFGSIVLASEVAVRIPADYFAHDRRPASKLSRRHPALRVFLHILKNLAAIVLLIAGAAMLVLPGQGLLTMFVGFLLLDFPGKYRLERWLVSRPRIHRAINWLRRRRGRPPLIQPS